MKILQINHSDISGGAARAAYRIHHALRSHGVDSIMLVDSATAGDWTVEGPKTKVAKTLAKIRSPLAGLLTKTLKTGNPIIHSPAIIPSRWHDRLNASDADVVHLHWVNGEMMSIADMGRIQKPVVWTLHDMWAFCGAEHYTEDQRWRDGYTSSNRPNHESGFDLNRWTATRKHKHWQRPLHIVTPSRWLADCVRQSVLMRDWPVTVVPNAIDTDFWQPVDKVLARQLLHLPAEVPLLLFGAMGGAKNPRKGFDLLQSALDHLRGRISGLELVIFGQLAPKEPVDLGFPIHYTGHLHDDISLRLLYSA
ncbi:MAG: glycosyltransferase, partial [Halothiobacillus sp.]|nr:glycosyltransferase [Halothiobacillus sp.]